MQSSGNPFPDAFRKGDKFHSKTTANLTENSTETKILKNFHRQPPFKPNTKNPQTSRYYKKIPLASNCEARSKIAAPAKQQVPKKLGYRSVSKPIRHQKPAILLRGDKKFTYRVIKKKLARLSRMRAPAAPSRGELRPYSVTASPATPPPLGGRRSKRVACVPIFQNGAVSLATPCRRCSAFEKIARRAKCPAVRSRNPLRTPSPINNPLTRPVMRDERPTPTIL